MKSILHKRNFMLREKEFVQQKKIVPPKHMDKDDTPHTSSLCSTVYIIVNQPLMKCK